MDTITEDELSAALTMNAKMANSLGGGLSADLESAGREAIVRAMQTYQREKGKFTTYANWFIRKAQIIERKNLLTPVRLPANTYLPLESLCLNWILNLAAPEPEEERFAPLYGALAELSPDDRALLFARYFDGKKQREIAQALGISKAAVGERLRKVEKRLGELMEMER